MSKYLQFMFLATNKKIKKEYIATFKWQSIEKDLPAGESWVMLTSQTLTSLVKVS